MLLNFYRVFNANCEDKNDKIDRKIQKFYVLRSIETFERVSKVLPDGFLTPQRKAELIMACFFVSQKQYAVTFWPISDYHRYLSGFFDLPTVSAFTKEFKKIELVIWNAVQGVLTPHGNFKDNDGLTYQESWKFLKDAKGAPYTSRPAGFDGNDGKRVEKAVDIHMKAMLIFDSISELGKLHGCEQLLFMGSDHVPEKFKSLHGGLALLCSKDRFFAMLIQSYFFEGAARCSKLASMTCLHFDTSDDDSWIPDSSMPKEEVKQVLNDMVQGMSDMLSVDYNLMLEDITHNRDYVLRKSAGFSEYEFDALREKIGNIAALQYSASHEVGLLENICFEAMETCRKILKGVDNLVEQALASLVLTDDARAARRARGDTNLRPKKFFRTTRESNIRIMTRVSGDSFSTPAPNMQHPVTIIPGPVKVFREFFEQKAGQKYSKLVGVKVNDAYRVACEVTAHAYVTRSKASDTASLAAHACEAEAKHSADKSKDWAAAANAAAAAATEAAAAADAAEAAARAVQSAIEEEQCSGLRCDEEFSGGHGCP